jgi:hypothetical protein
MPGTPPDTLAQIEPIFLGCRRPPSALAHFFGRRRRALACCCALAFAHARAEADFAGAFFALSVHKRRVWLPEPIREFLRAMACSRGTAEPRDQFAAIIR